MTVNPSALLNDPALVPPPAPGGPPGTLAWLRRSVARFASGPDHARRRGLALDALAPLHLGLLRTRARERTAAVLAAAAGPVDVMAVIARDVPVAVLAEALGAPGADVAAVRAIAAAYPAGGPDPAADAAVRVLTGAFGGADEASAARIGLLVQCCEATAGLVGNTLRAAAGTDTAALVARTAAADPPVLATYRQTRDATARLRVDLTALPFGAGPHACPGREHALALATGVCEALRHTTIRSIEDAPLPTLRMPFRLEVSP